MREDEVLIASLLDDACLTLEQLAAGCAVDPAWIVQRIEEGLLPPMRGAQPDWRFSSALLLRVRRMRALERDFDAVPELAALVADLLEEMDGLRRRLPHRLRY